MVCMKHALNHNVPNYMCMHALHICNNQPYIEEDKNTEKDIQTPCFGQEKPTQNT